MHFIDFGIFLMISKNCLENYFKNEDRTLCNISSLKKIKILRNYKIILLKNDPILKLFKIIKQVSPIIHN